MDNKKPYIAPEFQIVELTVGDIIMSSAISKPDDWIGWH